MAQSPELDRALEMFRAAFPRDPAEMSIEELRGYERAFWEREEFAVPAGASVEEVDADGVRGLLVSVEGASHDRILVWAHGGGFSIGTADGRQRFGADAGRAGDCQVLLVSYRLAPEHKFPAGLEDVVTACRWASERVGPQGVVVGGDSAGGALAVATLLALRERGAPMLAGAVPMSSMFDLLVTGDSHSRNAGGELVASGLELRRKVAERYLPEGHDPRDPLASPAYADLTGLPPLLIQVGSAEPLLDDSQALAERARAAGVDVEVDVGEDMFHFWPMFTEFLPEAREAIEHLGSFMRRVTRTRVAG